MQAIAGHDLRRRTRAAAERLDLEFDLGAGPIDFRQRQIAVGQGLLQPHVRPGQARAVDGHERFDRPAALARFDCAVLGKQRRSRATVDTDDRPVGLLDETARKAAARDPFCDVLIERTLCRAPAGVLDFDFVDAVAVPFVGRQLQAQVTQLVIADGKQVEVAKALALAEAGRPLLAVDRFLVRPRGRVLAVLPVQHETADLARLAQVDIELLRRPVRRITAPLALRIAVHCRGRRRILQRRRRRHAHLRRRLVGRRQFAQHQVVDVDRTLAAIAAGADDELDRGGMAQRVVGCRPPGEFDLAPAHADLLPVAAEFEVGPVVPPDVLAARIDEFELQCVDGCLATNPETQFEVVGQVEWQRAPRGGVAVDRLPVRVGEVEIQAQRLPGLALGTLQRRADVVGVLHLPCRRRIEIVEHALGRAGGDGVLHGAHQQERVTRHSGDCARRSAREQRS